MTPGKHGRKREAQAIEQENTGADSLMQEL
jgi:hypothetical protein